jgi:glutamate-1-semialdehyde 2,1-aminomutase
VFADTYVRNYREFVRHNDAEKFHEFWIGLLQAGVMIQPHQTGWFVSAAHSDSDIERTIMVARDVMSGIES